VVLEAGCPVGVSDPPILQALLKVARDAGDTVVPPKVASPDVRTYPWVFLVLIERLLTAGDKPHLTQTTQA